MSEGWGSNQQQQVPFSGRSYNNSNFSRGPRRNDGGGGGLGGGAGRPAYQNGSGFNGQRQNGGGYGQRQNGGGYGGGQSYENRGFGQNRPPRTSFGGPPRNGGGFQVVGDASSVFEIDSNKVGMVIGRKGGKIREIQENFQVHVKIGKRGFHFVFHIHSFFFFLVSSFIQVAFFPFNFFLSFFNLKCKFSTQCVQLVLYVFVPIYFALQMKIV